jgi:hypothetical protein
MEKEAVYDEIKGVAGWVCSFEGCEEARVGGVGGEETDGEGVC